MAGETGKQRRSRIELTYYRRPDALALRRRAFAAAAVLGATAWLVFAPTWDRNRQPGTQLFQWSRLASPGPLAHPHAATTDRCDACHAPFAPINASRWSPLPAREAHPTTTALCTACHAAADHHPVRDVAAVPSCAECHRDHRGPDARLTRPPDDTCTRCHADLAAHRLGDPKAADRVTAFDAAHHPDFAALQAADPGHLKFNHALHLAPGLTLQDGGSPFTLARLAESDRPRYATPGASDDAPVALDCAACHQPDAAGAYMKPVTYEQHCAACHPLTVDPAQPDRRVTHGLAPTAVVAELRGLYAQADDALLARRIPDRPLPGRPDAPADRAAREAIDAKMTTALRRLLGTGAAAGPDAKQSGCLECHQSIPHAEPLRTPDDYATLALAPTAVPAVWLPGARFDHHAHRASACLDCHTATPGSTSSRDLLIPNVQSCTACHAPSHTTAEGRPAGGVDHSCTECHRYHAR